MNSKYFCLNFCPDPLKYNKFQQISFTNQNEQNYHNKLIEGPKQLQCQQLQIAHDRNVGDFGMKNKQLQTIIEDFDFMFAVRRQKLGLSEKVNDKNDDFDRLVKKSTQEKKTFVSQPSLKPKKILCCEVIVIVRIRWEILN